MERGDTFVVRLAGDAVARVYQQDNQEGLPVFHLNPVVKDRLALNARQTVRVFPYRIEGDSNGGESMYWVEICEPVGHVLNWLDIDKEDRDIIKAMMGI